MKNRSLFLLLLLTMVGMALGHHGAQANDTPILTWEQGKLQSVVLGGGENKLTWEVELVSSSGLVTRLNSSLRNSENFVVFSTVIPRDFPIGVYTLITRGLSDDNSKVAIVNVVAAKSYEIGRVPGDLIYLFTVFIGFIALFVSMTRRRFSYMHISSVAPRERFINGEPAEGFIQGVHDIGRLERVRIDIQQNLTRGTMGTLMKANGAILHFRSRRIWSIFPLLLGALGLVGAAESPSQFGYLFLLICLLGNFDIFSGIVASVVFVSIATFNSEIFSFSVILGLISISCLFFLPGLIGQTLSAVTGCKLGNFEWVKIVMVVIFVHFIVLLQRSLLPESYFSTADELLVLATIILALVMIEFLSIKRSSKSHGQAPLEEVITEVEVLPSRSAIAILSIVVFGIVYAWSLRVGLSLLVLVLATLPLFISAIQLTKLNLPLRFRFYRNPLFEILLICAMTYLVFIGVTQLPLVTYSILETLLVLGFAPVILFGCYVAVASHGVLQSKSLNS